jgi:site-specific recombinase XerD
MGERMAANGSESAGSAVIVLPSLEENDAHALSLYTASRERAHDYASDAVAANTRRAYRADWRDFSAWCARHGLSPLPASAETVSVYLADLAGFRKTSTIGRRLSAIAQAHRTAGYPSPTAEVAVRQVMSGIRRRHGTRQQGKEAALTVDVRAMVGTLDGSVRGLRDRSLLLLGFAGAFRRSELVALDVADATRSRDGLVVTVRRSKTDQEGAGREVGIPFGSTPATCPVRALEDWLAAAAITSGPLFHPIDRHGNVRPTRLTDQSVALVVKRAALAAGLDAALYAGHSLRSGLATAAAQAGVSERTIMEQTGHKSLPIVRRYIRRGSLFTENAAAKIGL